MTRRRNVRSLSAERVSTLIHAIYAAGEDATLWSIFLEMLAEEIGSGMTVLLALDHTDASVRLASAVRTDPEAIRLYNEAWHQHDPWVASGHESLTRQGAVTLGEAMVGDRELLRTGFYNDFARHYEFFHTINATIVATPEMSAGLACHYPKGVEISDQARRLVELLTPHLTQAIRLHQNQERERLERSVTRHVLDGAGRGVCLLDATGRVVHANSAAEAILSRQDGLLRRRKRIAAASSQDDAVLARAIAGASGTAVHRDTDPGAVLAIRRTSKLPPYIVTVLPVSASGTLFERHRAAAMLLVRDPTPCADLDAEVLRPVFGWTAAETEVARLVVDGRRPNEIAALRGVSAHTVRSQLKSIFDKANVASQIELVLLILGTLSGF